MNGKNEIHFELKSAIETLVIHSGTDLDRLRSAVANLRSLAQSDFEHQIDRSCFAVVQRCIERLDLGDHTSIDMNDVRRQIWALYDRNSPKNFSSK